MAAGTAGATGKCDVTGQVPDLIAIHIGTQAPQGTPCPGPGVV